MTQPGQGNRNSSAIVNHAEAVLQMHRAKGHRGDEWRWWTPWRLERQCAECGEEYPCTPARRATRLLSQEV